MGRTTKRILLTLATIWLAPAATLHADDAPQKTLPLAGEVFRVEGRTAFVILPEAKSAGQPIPWVWYAPTLRGLPSDAEKWMFQRFTRAGIAIAGIDVGESYGSPAGRALYSAFYAALTTRRGFAAKPVMLGRSRGGLMTLAWAVENADKVAAFAGIYPVCNLTSYPGVAKASGAYDMTAEQLAKRLAEHNPIDRLDGLAKAGVPLFAIQGDSDRTVPLEANSGKMRKRYEALGGKMQLIVPPGQGHNMWQGFFQCQELVDFVIARANRTNPPKTDGRIKLDPPGGREFILDRAQLLDEKTVARLRATCDKLLTDRAIPIIIVTINSMAEHGGKDLQIETFARLLFDQWGIGHAKRGRGSGRRSVGRNNGILILVSKGDRKARIELGADWGREKDKLCKQIMDQQIVPRFKQGDFGLGISAGVEALDAMAREKTLPKTP